MLFTTRAACAKIPRRSCRRQSAARANRSCRTCQRPGRSDLSGDQGERLRRAAGALRPQRRTHRLHQFQGFWQYPDKNRTDYSKKGVIINLYIGDKGWTLDRGGVTELPARRGRRLSGASQKRHQQSFAPAPEEPGMTIRFGGTDIADLQVRGLGRYDRLRADGISASPWTAFAPAGPQHRHHPGRDPPGPRRGDQHLHQFSVDGRRVHPFADHQDRNGHRINQVFFTFCKYNPGFPGDFFTKAALEKRFPKSAAKNTKKKKRRKRKKTELGGDVWSAIADVFPHFQPAGSRSIGLQKLLALIMVGCL